ncbi:MAG: hypothetical protein J6T14_00435 [Clostridia bacterium]|nr:hypothetical protein [Clostridia bacterium]
MLNLSKEQLQELLLHGHFGLEKEMLRVTEDGHMAHSPDPFLGHPNITKDFCENQTEINTPVADSAEEAYGMLKDLYAEIQKTLAGQSPREYLWPFSNPAYIASEEDIPIAQFPGEDAHKTAYREYLAGRYGRFIMTYSGIHFNYSFSDELLKADYEAKQKTYEVGTFRDYKDNFYLDLAKKAAAYGWLMTAVTAASPVRDRSFLEPGLYGGSVFTGKGSSRCAHTGYWNAFTPVFDYKTLEGYIRGIEYFVTKGLLAAPSELYFPVRIKPRGLNTLDNLREYGASHIELRMFDLNPLDPVGLDLRDIKFGELFLGFLAGTQDFYFPEQDQVQAVQNFKRAAFYDLENTKIIILGGRSSSVADAGKLMLHQMKEFYRGFPDWVQDILAFEEAKFLDPANRYATKVRALAGDDFVGYGLKLAKEQQEAAYV